ncbi:hypothetical protein [Bradyrhizobium australiense]|uniref:Uncharacterized protein n=1 Tax=Bradyrhizobium australiense TaxID=2721161 RepID=A0A7Y4GT64_9BRAD|nr:hypothetical protein [Bradyrhizobium australiense]NOJ41302.1 hypothetical protein [Bradyrhizobium australiense]
MKMKSISLAAAFALACTPAFAQGNAAGGSSQVGEPAAKATGGADMKNGATGTTTSNSRPSSKDSSTQGAGTAGAVDKKGEAASPGGTMKK